MRHHQQLESLQAPEKRRSAHSPEDDRGGKYRTVQIEDPEDLADNEAGNFEVAEIPEVFVLAQRRPDRFPTHPGKFEVCELFSPPRVSAAASPQGLRGGFSLDLEC